ncbi:hypothetical protein ACHAQA_006078 [Verticillium albo-atrum]
MPMPVPEEQWNSLAGLNGPLTDKTPGEICQMRQSDAQSTWQDSGAHTFLDGFIKTQGASHWLYNMDGKTTGDGLKEGVLLCESLTDKCDLPTLEACQYFTPPAYYWIRRAASNLHGLLDGFHETLQSQTIQASLDIGRMVKDFAAEPLQRDAGPNVAQILSIFANAIGIAGGFAGVFGAVGKLTNTVSLNSDKVDAIVNGAGIASNAVFIGAYHAEDGEPDIDSVTLGLTSRLSQVFKSMDDSIADLTRLVFAGEENPNDRGMTFDHIRVLPIIRLGHAAPPQDFAHPISQFFGGGEFLVDVENGGKSRLQESFKTSITNVQRSLISGLLHDLRVYVVKDSSQEGQARCGETGSRHFDGYCWFLYRSANDAPWQADPLSQDVMIAFHNWGIDIEQVYRNAEACRAAHGFGGWESYFNEIGGNVYTGADSFGYAPCFWGSLPVFEVTDESREKNYFSVAVDGVCKSTSHRDGDEKPDAPEHLGIRHCPLVAIGGA